MVGQKDRQAGRCGMGQRKKTSQEDDDRTTSMGLFNTAEAYRLSAMALELAQAKIGHADKPVQLLYAHAIELYLKALLRQEHSVEAIRKGLGHNTGLLVKEAEKLGLFVTAGDRDVFAIMEDTDALIEMRYIRTGAKTSLNLKALSRVCKSVRDSVGGLLREADMLVRLKEPEA
jgi:hypothetical protein